MTRDEAIARIKPHEPALRQAGMASLYLFGSTARGDARDDSDIDLSCDLNEKRPLGLLDFINLQHRLEHILGSRVDLVERNCLLPRARAHADKDMVRIF